MVMNPDINQDVTQDGVAIPRPAVTELIKKATTGRHVACPRCGRADLVHAITRDPAGNFEAGCSCACGWGSAIYTVPASRVPQLRREFAREYIRAHFASRVPGADDAWRVVARHVGASCGAMTIAEAVRAALAAGTIARREGVRP